jgi:hypothetical protein
MYQLFAQRIVASWLGKLLIGGAAFLVSVRYAGGVYAYLEAEKCERPLYTVVERLTGGVEIRQYEPYMIAETAADDESSAGFQKAGRDTFGTLAGYIFGKNKARRGRENEKMAMTAPVRFDGDISRNKKTRYVYLPYLDKVLELGRDLACPDSLLSNHNLFRLRCDHTYPSSHLFVLIILLYIMGVFSLVDHYFRVSFVIGSSYTMKTVPKPLEKRVKLRQVPAHTLAVKKFSGKPPSDERIQKERNALYSALSKADIHVKQKDDTTLVYGYHDPVITPNLLRRNEVAVVIEGSV